MSQPDPPVAMEIFESPDVQAVRVCFKSVEDLLDNTRKISTDPEVQRWASIAITNCQIASMCSIRALTGGK